MGMAGLCAPSRELLGDGRARRGPVLEGDAFADASVSRGAVLDLGMQR